LVSDLFFIGFLMQNVFKAKIYFLTLMLLLGYGGSTCAAKSKATVGNAYQMKQEPMKGASINTDQYMATFLKSIGSNDKVVYKKEKLVLFADYSMLITALLGAGGFAALAFGSFVREEDVVRALCMVAGVGLGAGALYRLSKSLQKEIYLILDNEGIIAWGNRKLSWDSLHKIEIENVKIYDEYGMLTGTSKIAHFVDKYGNTVFLTSTNDEHLPIPLDNFLAVAEHYWKKNKAKY
jgi:hypothetical protein